MAVQTVAPSAATVAGILDSDEVAALVSELDALRWTGRKGYGARALVGACLVKSLYAIPTWTRTASLIREHFALSGVLGGTPSEWACYRFAKKLLEHKPVLDACLDRVVGSLRFELPDAGTDLAIDSSDLPGYGNGQRFLSKNGPERERFSDPDASWGHRSGHLYAEGRRLLRFQTSRRRMYADGTASRMADRVGTAERWADCRAAP